MKKIMLAVCMMFGAVAFVNAQEQDTTSTQSNQSTEQSTTQDQTMQDQDGQKIEVSELPEAIQTSLQSQDYQGWVVNSAHKKNWVDPNDPQASSKEVYVVEVRNGTETKKLKFDKDGNKIDDMKNKDDDQK